jgi:Calpain family cysteine protease
MSIPYPIIDRTRQMDDPVRPRALPPSSRPPTPKHDPTRPSTPLPHKQSIVGGPAAANGANGTTSKKKRTKPQHAQTTIDNFWSRFTAPNPAKPFIVLPDNAHAVRAANSGSQIAGKNAQASYAEARAACMAKVAKIVRECRRLNVKYRDPHFDIEDDFRKWTSNERPYANCLMGLNEIRTDMKPMSVKRVEDIFEAPQFFIDGATANDVRQGKEGDCWFMSAICTLSNKESLISRVCVARDEQVGVYGFVFHRDGEEGFFICFLSILAAFFLLTNSSRRMAVRNNR